MPFWEGLLGNKNGPKPKWLTGEVYDVLGGDHVKHVQAKIDAAGEHDNFEIIVAEPNQLQIDYDVSELPAQFEKALDILTQAFCKNTQCLHYFIKKSRHGNLHVTINLPINIPDTERIAWQAVFGSDPTREAMSLMSVRREIANPTLLIERRNAAPIMTGISVPKPLTVPKGRLFRDITTASD